MKKIVGLIVLGAAIVGIGKAVSAGRQGGLVEKMEAFMEGCPPIQAMRRLEEQNSEVISLLRDQNALLRSQSPPQESVAESASGGTFAS